MGRRPKDDDYEDDDEEEEEEVKKEEPVQIAEREINLSLINDKLNFLISKLVKPSK